VLRNLIFAIGGFAITMGALALLYLMLAPFLLFAAQLLVFTGVSAFLLLGLLRRTGGIEPAPDSPFSPELIAGVAVGSALMALVGLVVGATNWPVRITGVQAGFGGTVANQYVVAIAVVVVLLASAALGAALLMNQRIARRFPR
jgi:NADH:ubiquinone oxidoreductase subunit 6 (subunit J)